MAAPLEHLRRDLERVFGTRLRALVAYGSKDDHTAPAPARTLAIVDRVTHDDLVACATCAAGWRRLQLAIPLILGSDEFARSLDAFPIEYSAIISDHVTIVGEDPFAGLHVQQEDLRRACEVQAKSHLIHLREGFLEAEGNPSAVAQLIERSVPAFAALLRVLLQVLRQRDDLDLSTLPDAAGKELGLPETTIREVLQARNPARKIDTSKASTLYQRYLTVVEQLAQFVDRR